LNWRRRKAGSPGEAKKRLREAKLPQRDDKANYSKETRVPVGAMGYSDFIKNGRWGEVGGVLRKVYEEASETLGRKFEYPSN
jgi:hypothetical protein